MPKTVVINLNLPPSTPHGFPGTSSYSIVQENHPLVGVLTLIVQWKVEKMEFEDQELEGLRVDLPLSGDEVRQSQRKIPSYKEVKIPEAGDDWKWNQALFSEQNWNESCKYGGISCEAVEEERKIFHFSRDHQLFISKGESFSHTKYQGDDLILTMTNPSFINKIRGESDMYEGYRTHLYLKQGTMVGMTSSAETRPDFKIPPLSKRETFTLTLECFLAACRQRDIKSILPLIAGAKGAAIKLREQKRYGEAFESILLLLPQYFSYPSLYHDLSFYYVDLGEVYESCGMTAKAAQSYFRATEMTSLGWTGPGMASHCFNCFALCLKRMEKYLQACGAYLCALSYPCTITFSELIKMNLGNCLEAYAGYVRFGRKANPVSDNQSLHRQNKQVARGVLVEFCTGKECEKEAPLKCSQCGRAFYCSRECQKKNWPEHKVHCKNWRPKKEK